MPCIMGAGRGLARVEDLHHGHISDQLLVWGGRWGEKRREDRRMGVRGGAAGPHWNPLLVVGGVRGASRRLAHGEDLLHGRAPIP